MKKLNKRKIISSEVLDSFGGKNILQLENINFKYPGAKRGVLHLDDVSIDIEKGKWTTILGPNGSGKSTIAKTIVRINKPKSGKVLLKGIETSDFKGKQFARNVAYIPQQIEIPHGTSVYDFVSFGRNPYLGVTGTLGKVDKQIIKAAMDQTQTWDMKDKMMDELSGGQRQKVLIAMIVVQDAEIILLDEPTTYLDIRNQYELLEMMHYEHSKGKTIITILHDINQAVQYSDNIYIMKKGKLHSKGTPDKVINSKSLADVYGVDAQLYTDKGGRRYLTDVKLIDFKIGDLTHDKIEHKHTRRSPVHTVDTVHPVVKKSAAKKASTAQKKKTTATKSPKTEKSK